jgi:flagellar protein FlgJ
MTAPLSSPQLTQVANELAADSRSLDGLKRDAQRDPRGAMRKAAQQFEALFMQMVLKSMREATPKSGLFDSPANDMYTGMLDQQIATRISQSGTGLADVIVRQLTRHLPGAAAAPVDASSAGAPVSGASITRAPTAAARALSHYGEMARTARAAAVSATDASTAAPLLGATDAQRNFVTRHWDAALAAQRATGIPAQHVIGQAALESGWGKAEIRGADGLPSFNLFGIKATGGWREVAAAADTVEYERGRAVSRTEQFRAYGSLAEGMRDYARLIAGSPRYAAALNAGADAGAYAAALQRGGYATDPCYATKLVRVAESVQSVLRGAVLKFAAGTPITTSGRAT